MTPGAAAIVANAVVIGRPVWTPAVIAALAAMFHAQRTTETAVRTPPEVKTPETANVR